MNKRSKTGRKLMAATQTTVGREVIRFVGLFLVIMVFVIWTKGKILNTANLKNIWKQSVFLLIGGAGAVFVMAQGHLNFSIGGVIALSGMCFGVFGAIHPWMAVPAALLVGVLCELLLVYGHIALKVPPFIVSFAIMFLTRGILSGFTQKTQVVLPRAFRAWNTPNLYYFIAIAVLVVAFIIFERTKIGKYGKALGSNYDAAVASGVKANKFKVIAYAICGVTCGICGCLQIIRGGGISGGTGSGLETEILIAMVLGGIPLSGGTKVRMTGILAGALMLSVLENGMTVVGLDSDLTGLVKGIVFLCAVAVSYDRKPEQIIT